MPNDEPRKTVKVPVSLHREISMQSVRLDFDIQDIVEEALEEKLVQLKKIKGPVAA